MRLLFTILLVSITSICWAYRDYNKYDWEDSFDQDLYTNYVDHSMEGMLVRKRTIIAYEYFSDYAPIKRKKYSHKIFWVEDQSAIEKLNRVYLYTGGSEKVSFVKTRTITLDGRVTELDQSKLEDVSKEEGSASYKILSIPGIQEKSWVEVIVCFEGSRYDTRILENEDLFTAKAEVILQYPTSTGRMSNHFSPRAAYYNGYKEDLECQYTIDANYEYFGSSKFKYYSINDVPAKTNEKYSHEYRDRPRVDLTRKIRTWLDLSSRISDNIFDNQYRAFSQNKGRKILKSIGAYEVDEKEAIVRIEKFIKEEITKTKSSDDKFTRLSGILKGRIANNRGLVRLFNYLLKVADIQRELYLVSDEDYIELEKEFPFTLGLSDFLFYFPEIEMYSIPTNKYYRLGKVPNYLGGCNALWMRTGYSNPNIRTAKLIEEEKVIEELGYLRKLPSGSKEYNIEQTKAQAVIDIEEDKVKVKLVKNYYGDRAIRSRGYLNYNSEDDKKEYIRNVLISEMENTKLQNEKIKNDAIDLNVFSVDTLSFSGDLISEDLLSPIPNGYIVGVTKLIGKQGSFYDKEERNSLKVYADDSKVYDHEIVLTIPKGYTIEDINNHVMSAVCNSEDGRVIASFESKARIEDGNLIISVYEFYIEGEYSNSILEDYRKVVNAAYEFYISKSRLMKN
ncbi:MAG: hypothetical protein MK066_11400 [Crocinitomicaceae bacterium]|nr:hypothetical protein [Crocinitomicaceae bacterium]